MSDDVQECSRELQMNYIFLVAPLPICEKELLANIFLPNHYG